MEPPARLTPEALPPIISIVGSMPTTLHDLATTIVLPTQPHPGPVRVGGDIRRPEKIKHVDPVYPAIAKAARVSGMVIVEAIIAADGTVRGARVIRSVPMLDRAALEAVSQWRYTATMLNGQPMEVIVSVNVTFAIN